MPILEKRSLFWNRSFVVSLSNPSLKEHYDGTPVMDDTIFRASIDKALTLRRIDTSSSSITKRSILILKALSAGPLLPMRRELR